MAKGKKKRYWYRPQTLRPGSKAWEKEPEELIGDVLAGVEWRDEDGKRRFAPMDSIWVEVEAEDKEEEEAYTELRHLIYEKMYQEYKAATLVREELMVYHQGLVRAAFPARGEDMDALIKVSEVRRIGNEGLRDAVAERVGGDRRAYAEEAFVDDFAFTSWMVQLLKEKMLETGDVELINEAVSLLNRRAKMVGYDSPEKVQFLLGGDMSEITDATRALMLQARDEVAEFEAALLEGGLTGDVIEGEYEEGDEEAEEDGSDAG